MDTFGAKNVPGLIAHSGDDDGTKGDNDGDDDDGNDDDD